MLGWRLNVWRTFSIALCLLLGCEAGRAAVSDSGAPGVLAPSPETSDVLMHGATVDALLAYLAQL